MVTAQRSASVALPAARASAGTAPRPAALRDRSRRLPVLPLVLKRDGRLASPAQVGRLASMLGGVTDCFILCDGGVSDESHARERWTRFFALLEPVLASLGERIVPLGVGLHWPSNPRADGSRPAITDDTLWPSVQAWLTAPARERGEIFRLALDLCGAEIPASPEEETELDVLLERLRHGSRHDLTSSVFLALTSWVMKRRAGQVGERFGRDVVGPLWQGLAHPPRLHLVGASFGATLATAAILGGVRPESLTLVLARSSAFAFAPHVPGFKRPGHYHRLLAERLVNGPVVVLRTDHDTAGAMGSGPALRSGLRKRDARIATSALAVVGARGVAAPELDLGTVQQTGIPTYPIVNVDGTRVLRARREPMEPHADIFYSEVATLVAMAAGLVVGGPERSRPTPLDPLFRP
jgi:hypothetical protein